MLALKALKAKLRKMMMGGGEMQSDAEKLLEDERGENNNAEDARELAEVEQAVDGEDGEKEVSIEIEAEGDSGGMADLYAKMREEFGGMPESRKASGMKKGLMGGVGAMKGKMRGKR